MFLSLETLTSITRTSLPVMVELIDLVELCYYFSISMTLLSKLTFLLRSQTLILTVLLIWIYFFLLTLVFICSTMPFPSLGNSDYLIVSVSIDFPSNSQQDVPFHRISYDHSRVDWHCLCDHLRDVLLEDIFKLEASAAAHEFCEWVQVGIDVYITH